MSKHQHGCYLSVAVSASGERVCAVALCENVCWLWILLMGDMLFSQIRPSDGGYGFTLEERNRVPIIKSVEKGSPAEVRLCTHFQHMYAAAPHMHFLVSVFRLQHNEDEKESRLRKIAQLM